MTTNIGPGLLTGPRLHRRISPRLRRQVRSAILDVVQDYACGGRNRLPCIHGPLLRFASSPSEKPGLETVLGAVEHCESVQGRTPFETPSEQLLAGYIRCEFSTRTCNWLHSTQHPINALRDRHRCGDSLYLLDWRRGTVDGFKPIFPRSLAPRGRCVSREATVSGAGPLPCFLRLVAKQVAPTP